MKLIPGIALLLAIGCADNAEIPTIELGGASGARLMNGQARSTFEAYDNAYSQLTRQHYNVRRNLDGRNNNVYAARAAMERIVSLLEAMRSLVPAADQSRFDSYLAKYKGWQADLDRGTWGGSFMHELDKVEQEVKSKFHPDRVEIATDVAPKPAPAAVAPRESAPAPKDPSAPIPSDKVELPTVKNPTPPAQPAPRPVDAAPTAPATGISPRILYNAWDRAHDELVACCKAKKECKTRYEDVLEALRLLKAQLAGEKALKLQIWIDYYGDIHEKTKGFTMLPEKTTDKDIQTELDVAARMIRKEFNPEK